MLFALAALASAAPPPPVVKLGTADLSMVECTPVLWQGKLLRFESVRGNYNGFTPRDPNMKKDAYYRFRDVQTQAITTSFAKGFGFGSALVQTAAYAADGRDTMWVFGTDSNQTYVRAFKSTDLQTWEQSIALQLPSDYKAFNNAVTKDGASNTYTMAIELGSPTAIVGARFTSVFARVTGPDLSTGFALLDPTTHVYTKAEYSACPTIRKFGDYFYVATLFAHNGYQEMLVRSKDLISWEGPHGTSNGTAYNPMLLHGDTKSDRAINADSWNYNTNFSDSMKTLISNALDINNSDIDFCDDGKGGVYITYSWGNQEGVEFLGAAMVKDVTVKEWLESYF